MIRSLLATLFTLAVLAGGALYGVKWELRRPGPQAEAQTIVIARGTPTLEIGRQLAAAHIVDSPYSFFGVVHLFRGPDPKHDGLKAGEYQFALRASLSEVIGQMRAGRVVLHRVTIPEGLTNFQIAALLQAEPALSGPVGTLPQEGHLMPDTYTFTRDDSRASVVQRMRQAAQMTLDEDWAIRDTARINAVKLTAQQALVLASIIEKETGIPAERPRVSGIFYNRLQKGMALESDPTIIYAMSDGQGTIDHPLSHHDLAFASPYNTYANHGLPPTPICNPGRASIEAALHPEANDFLFFVATGQGGHNFAASVADQNRNVAEYVKTLREKK